MSKKKFLAEPEPRSETAIKRLGVTPEQLAGVPDISSILKEVHGGRSLALQAMRFSSADIVKAFLKKYDSIPERDRLSLPLEAVAISARLDVGHLYGEIMLSMREYNANKYKLIAVSLHPQVIKDRFKFARSRQGYRDRDAIDTMLGALPSNKGTTFINKFFAGGAKEAGADVADPEDPVDDLDFIFPDSSEMQEHVQPMRQKLLGERK